MAIDINTLSQYFQYPSKVTELRDRLYRILRDKGIEVTANESLNSLIEKVRTVEPALIPQTIYITENNTTYDVTEYTDAVVNVPVETIANDLDGLVDGSLKSFTMPSQISTLAHRRFYDFVDLSQISMPQVNAIPSYTFYNCNKLSEADIPEATSIGNYAFANCYTLSDINAPNVITLGNYVFDSCYNLQSFSNKNITELSDGTFRNNFKLSMLSLPNLTQIYGSETFTNCSNLSELSLPNLVYITDSVFAGGRGLNNLKNISFPKLTNTYTALPPNQLNTILNLSNLISATATGYYFISDYSNLTSLNLDNLTSFYGGLIYNCNNISELNLSRLVSAYSGTLANSMQNLRYLNINHLASMSGYSPVANCFNLEKIDMYD